MIIKDLLTFKQKSSKLPTSKVALPKDFYIYVEVGEEWRACFRLPKDQRIIIINKNFPHTCTFMRYDFYDVLL